MESSVFSRYKRIKMLGSGGCGDAFLARDRMSGKLVTLKCIRNTDEKKYRKAKESLDNEAEILKRLRCKGIPRLIDCGEGYIATEYISGKSLYNILKEGGRLKEKEVIRIGNELVRILSYLHGLDKPVIYRDLKPSNIIIGANGNVALIDYGASRIYRKGETNENVYKAVDFMLSPEGQKIVEDSGYIPVIKPE